MGRKVDLDGVPELLHAVLSSYELGKRGTGRTTRMLNGIDSGQLTLLICANFAEKKELEYEIGKRQFDKVQVKVALTLEDLHRITTGGKWENVLFSHLFVFELFYKQTEALARHLDSVRNSFTSRYGDKVPLRKEG